MSETTPLDQVTTEVTTVTWAVGGGVCCVAVVAVLAVTAGIVAIVFLARRQKGRGN